MFGERSFVVLCYCVCEAITPPIGTLDRRRDRHAEGEGRKGIKECDDIWSQRGARNGSQYELSVRKKAVYGKRKKCIDPRPSDDRSQLCCLIKGTSTYNTD